MKKNIIFLYTEIAEYFLACIEELSKENVNIHIVRWSVNKEAPFKFRKLENVTFYNRNSFSEDNLSEKIKQINPNILLTSGWIDKEYTKIAKIYRKQIPVVLCLDNQWTASIKQRISTTIGRNFIKKHFSHAWVPGEKQKKYAKRLGFKQDKIKTGFYSADYKLYNKYFEESFPEKEKLFPKNFLFTGRYIEQKGIFNLWEAFIKFHEEYDSNQELICIGTGELFDKKIIHPKIKHLGFLQPEEIENVIKNTGIFILPSKFEPWGVVVHEYVTAGYPIICSDKIGAASTFLQEGKNGYSYKYDDTEALKNLMIKISEKEDKELIKMAKSSRKLSEQITPEKWVKTLMTIIK